MSVALVSSIENNFSNMEDPRKETKNKNHNFVDILVIAMCGAICGANHWTSIAAYGRAKEDWFRTFLALPEGIPSHDTFNDVFTKINAEQFEKCFIEWVASITHLLPGEVISIDGKTLRRSHDKGNGKKSIHMVSAWSTNNEIVLGQFKTEEKSNEITAIPILLETLSIEKCLVTIDAMGCQKRIAETILEKGADYLLAVKENQPNLYAAINELFFESNDATFDLHFHDFSEKTNKGHGRLETRRCWVFTNLDKLNFDVSVWRGLSAFIIIESERTLNGITTTEHRLYITSEKNKSASDFIKATRDHWHVENKLHWVLDVAFREDESRLRKGDGAENFSILRRISLNLLKKEKTDKTGIETKRLRAGWDNKYLMKVVSGMSA
ncbi:MAG: ISAs1 family transposase [Gammaproteobacteria bacterium]|nr:ISAs1 family transposase [Gammaproteobacteria bacterium]